MSIPIDPSGVLRIKTALEAERIRLLAVSIPDIYWERTLRALRGELDTHPLGEPVRRVLLHGVRLQPISGRGMLLHVERM